MDAVEVDRWQGAATAVWQQRLGVPDLHIFRRVGSTNDVALDLAGAGTPEGTLVLADEQTKGRGRRGRAWSAPHGASLSMSMVLRPDDPDSSRLLTLRLGLAAARGLERTLPVRVQLKWPNDLEVDGKKIGGILCEGVSVEHRLRYVVAGIGLNLRRPDDGWPPDLADRATSLHETAGTPVQTPELVSAIVTEWMTVVAHPAGTLTDEERTEFDARDALRGHEVAVESRPAGVAQGISAGGSLRVRQDGTVTEVTAGTVRIMNPAQEQRGPA